MKTVKAYIALGANLGDCQATLQQALTMLAQVPQTQVCSVSDFMWTEPVGGPAGQSAYLNAAAELETSLSAKELFDQLQRIEAHLGRDRSREQRWGPRTCDLDLLMWDDLVMDTEELTLPHPRMHERDFVLVPLSQIAGHAVHPVLKKRICELLEELTTQ